MYEEQLKAMIGAAKEAEKAIMKIYEEDFAIEIKSDNSPVTIADKTADKIISDHLLKAFPDYGMLTEESVDTKERLSKEFVFIVDPVDGTKEFVLHDDGFTTNIALARNHELVVGVIHIPAQGITYYAVRGEGAYRINKDGTTTRIHTSTKKTDLICLTSKNHHTNTDNDIIDRHRDVIGSSMPTGAAIKYCRIAEGAADVCFRMKPGTKEWDTASGQIIVEEAGGAMLKLDGTKYLYNREDVYNNDPYEVINRVENFIK